MKLTVLGPGCVKCLRLENHVKNAVDKLKLNVTIEHVYDVNKIIGMGVYSTPAFAIDGKIVSSGKVLSEAEIADLLKK